MRCRRTPTSSSSFSRWESTFGPIPGSPSRRSVNRFGPSTSSRTTRSAQRSPIRSSACALPQPWSYLRRTGISGGYALVVDQDHIVRLTNLMIRFSNYGSRERWNGLAPLEAVGCSLQRLLHGHPRRGHCSRRDSFDRPRPAHVHGGSPVGRERVHAHVRRTAPSWWPRGRSAWAPAPVPWRTGAFHRLLPALRPRTFWRRVDRLPRRSGLG